MHQTILIGFLTLLCTLPAQAQESETVRFFNKQQLVEISLDDRINSLEKKKVTVWIRSALDALATVHGEWPQDHLLIEVSSIERVLHELPAEKRESERVQNALSGSPVPWGQVIRGTQGQPDSVLLFVNMDYDDTSLRADWTIYHELSHLFIPFKNGGRWFTEGLASYYQNLIQGRAGLLSEAEMWDQLVQGFERGALPHQAEHLTLAQASRQNAAGSIMRVYWSGVMYWLEMDIWLRANRGSSLDEALHRLKQCCTQKNLSASRITRLLDESSETSRFTKRFEYYASTLYMPSAAKLLADLGVFQSDGETRLLEDQRLSDIRRDIYQPSDFSFESN